MRSTTRFTASARPRSKCPRRPRKCGGRSRRPRDRRLDRSLAHRRVDEAGADAGVLGKRFPIARHPVVVDLIDIGGKLERAAHRRHEVPVVVRAEDMTPRTARRLPAFAVENRAADKHFLHVAEMAFQVLEARGLAGRADEEEVVVIGRALGAREHALLVFYMVGNAEAQPLDIKPHAAIRIVAEIDDVPDLARLAGVLEADAAVDRARRRQAGDIEGLGFGLVGVAAGHPEAEGETFIVDCMQHAVGVTADLAVLAELGADLLEHVLVRTPQTVSRAVAPPTGAAGSEASEARRSSTPLPSSASKLAPVAPC